MKKIYKNPKQVTKNCILVDSVGKAQYYEKVEILLSHGKKYTGHVAEIQGSQVVINVHGSLEGVSWQDIQIKFLETEEKIKVSSDMIGHIGNALFQPLENYPAFIPEQKISLHSLPLPESERIKTADILLTGDGTNESFSSVYKGEYETLFWEKEIFDFSLLFHFWEKIKNQSPASLILIGTFGILPEEAKFMIEECEKRSLISSSIVALHKTSDTAGSALFLPHRCLSIAEYFAFQKQKDVIVILWNVEYYEKIYEAIQTSSSSSFFQEIISLSDRTGCQKNGGSITLLNFYSLSSETKESFQDLMLNFPGKKKKIPNDLFSSLPKLPI